MKGTLTALALSALFLAPLANAVPITIHFSYDDGAPVTAVASVNATPIPGGGFWATDGTFTLTGGARHLNESFDLVPGGTAEFPVFDPTPGVTADNMVYPWSDPVLDFWGLVGVQSANFYVTVFGSGPGRYGISTYDSDLDTFLYTFEGPITTSIHIGVPDGGATVGLLGVALVGMGWARRKLA